MTDNEDDATLGGVDREAIVEQLDDVVDELRYKLTGKGRIRDAENERVRVQMANAIIRALKAQNTVKSDAQLDDIERRLEKIEEDGDE